MPVLAVDMYKTVIVLFNFSSPPSMRTTTWHVDDLEQSQGSSDSDSTTGGGGAGGGEWQQQERSQEGQQLLTQAAKRVWEELYVCKKQVSAGCRQAASERESEVMLLMTLTCAPRPH